MRRLNYAREEKKAANQTESTLPKSPSSKSKVRAVNAVGLVEGEFDRSRLDRGRTRGQVSETENEGKRKKKKKKGR